MFLKVGGNAYINLGEVRTVHRENWGGKPCTRLNFADGSMVRYTGGTGDRVIAAIESLCIDDPTPPTPPIPIQRMGNKKGR